MKDKASALPWSSTSVFVACVVIGAVGFWFGRRHSDPITAMDHDVSRGIVTAPNAAASLPAEAADTTTEIPSDAAAWNARWAEILSERSTPARNARLAAMLEELAKTDPQRALELARGVSDWRLRELFRAAALRGWAETKPDEAAAWALTTGTDERRAVVEAVMQGAARNPPAAVRVALNLCAADPERAGDYGQYTVTALADGGAFSEAVRFGLEVGTEKYPFLLKSAMFQWARHQPAHALAGLDNIPDELTRGVARGEAIAGWAWADAKGLAEHAAKLPAGGERAQMLAEALPRWVEKDPTGAAEWINRTDAAVEADAGVVAMANLQSLITQKPTLAMQLASGISNPSDRSHTMRAVFRQWAQQDRVAAQQFAATASAPEDRAILENEFKDVYPE